MTTGLQVVRDWALPAGWDVQPDAAALGAAPPLFEDPWGVLEPPGGAVTVAVHSAELPGARADREPPTLLLERRGLDVPPGQALRRLVEPGPLNPGRLRQHTVIHTAHGPVTVIRTRPWRPDGPAVRIVAVIVPDSSRDAVVLTFTWDDEDGMDALEALARDTVHALDLKIEPLPQALGAEPEAAPQQDDPPDGGGDGWRLPPFPPRSWVGTWRSGTLGAVAGRVTAIVHALAGRTFRPATVAVALLAAVFLVSISALATSAAGRVLAVVAMAGSCVVPAILCWRAWTRLHGLVTDSRDWVPLIPPREIRATGLWYYLAAAAVLGVVLFGSLVTAGWVRAPGMLLLWLLVHVLLIVLEHARVLTPRLRQRRATSLRRATDLG